MYFEEFREYCLRKPFVTEGFPFDQSTIVFKVGGKLFFLADIDQFTSINLKALPEKAIEQRERYSGIMPGYHMNKKHWNTVQVHSDVPMDMSLRWDKYIWAVRLAKTRSQASEELSKGRIKINASTTKPAREPKVGDKISVVHNSATFTYQVVQLLDKRVGAKLVVDYLLDITPPEELEKLKLYQASQQNYRQNGSGKPTKKDRREIDDFLVDWD
ncbi:MAG: hypothetical protein RJA13_1866 [Bacteroidota bacterium]